jgi:hypothetical protein
MGIEMRVVALLKNVVLGLVLFHLGGVVYAVEPIEIDELTIRVIENDDAIMANELTLPFSDDEHRAMRRADGRLEDNDSDKGEIEGAERGRERDEVEVEEDDRKEIQEDDKDQIVQEKSENDNEVPEPEEPVVDN